jgi:hypothetical protein
LYAVSGRVNDVPDTGIVAVLVGLKFIAGFIIGAVTAMVMYRRRLTVAQTLRASLGAGVVFVLVSGVAGWAGAHAAFENGRRMDIAPWGEDLRFRNAIAENEILLCVITSIGIAALANVGTKNQSL